MREPYLTLESAGYSPEFREVGPGRASPLAGAPTVYLTNNGQLELAYAALSSQGDNLDSRDLGSFATVNIAGAAVNSGSFDFRPSDYSVPAGYLALQVKGH